VECIIDLEGILFYKNSMLNEGKMDRILQELVTDFFDQQEYPKEDDDKNFEKFVVHTIISQEYNREFDLDVIHSGGYDDTGIDGLGIIVNGLLVESKDDIDQFIAINNSLDATFIFVQSKNSSGFEGREINDFGYGVRDFFSENPQLRRNSFIDSMAKVSNYLFSKAKLFSKNPKCKLFFVTAGGKFPSDDKNLTGYVKSSKDELQNTNLFSQIEFRVIGSQEISQIYRKNTSSLSTSFLFNEKVVLPEIPGVDEAFFGVLPLAEFKKLLMDENENLNNAFYDNIRDFQGLANPVNTKIIETLSSDTPELFSVLNNGITVVASSINMTGNKVSIKDYQIVNGCQTSYVLYNYIKNQNENNEVRIPIKLVITNNDEVKTRITIATNSQTAIRREQLQAMTNFQKNLESFYGTYHGIDQIFYERRPGQYQSNTLIKKSRIISIANQIKAFGSMYLEIPHFVTTYFGRVVRDYIEIPSPKIFNETHQPIWYYTSALAFYKLESLFKQKMLPKEFQKFKWFIIMIFAKQRGISTGLLKLLNNPKKANQVCDLIIEFLNDDEKAKNEFLKACTLLASTGINLSDKQLLKSSEITEMICRRFNQLA
jgi:hypothetical protein